ncbi:Hypothetical protein NGAL_HAMBI490_60510 [Neorhizobium galegae bv. officinalis]|nr:Hypothetical protein NGAL_HAMBI490_60510 [Neorhizobium galegae bv. officinalis]
MAQKQRKNLTGSLDEKPVNKKTLKARSKVEALRDFLRSIQTAQALHAEIRKGLVLDWEGLRAKAACGSDALHKNNPTLRSEIEAEKLRLEDLASRTNGVQSDLSSIKPLIGDENLKEKNKQLTLVNKTLDQANKNLKQELNGARLSQLGLLSTIEKLEQELRQLKHSSGLT